MRRYFLPAAAILAMALSRPASAQARDGWFGPDKVKHFFLTAFVHSVTYGLARATQQSHQSSMLWASASSLTFGLGKEVHDARRGAPFSVRDLAWDAAGAGVASLALRRMR